jgi:hypothetical protein
MDQNDMHYRAITLAVLLTIIAVVACGCGQVRTETSGYGDRYYQLGRSGA